MFMPTAPEAAELVAEVRANAAILLQNPEKADQFFAFVEAEAKNHDFDIKTQKGRDAIVSRAHEVRKLKAGIDDVGKKLTEQWRTKTNAVNARRNIEKARLEGLIEDIRRPVTEIEQREADLKAEGDRIILELRQSAVLTSGLTVEEVEAIREAVRGMNLNAEALGPRLQMAEDLKADALTALDAAIADMKQREAEQAELQRLRQEAEQRAQEDAKRIEAEQQAKRIADAEKVAAERAAAEAKEAAEREAQRQIDEANAKAAQEVREANERAAEAERQAQAERDRIAEQERADAAAKAKADAEEQARIADQEHRDAVMENAALEIANHHSSIGVPDAFEIVGLIAAGKIPALSIKF
jgi:hypothetical protein